MNIIKPGPDKIETDVFVHTPWGMVKFPLTVTNITIGDYDVHGNNHQMVFGEIEYKGCILACRADASGVWATESPPEVIKEIR